MRLFDFLPSNNMNGRLFLLINLLLTLTTFSQNSSVYPQTYFQKPLEIPIILSGTFGELRSNHFHSGMDIKTQQREGFKVFAAADGYVSRINIQEGGYGKALYIAHPNGYTSVYAHLQKFGPEIEAYIKAEQYKKESYTIERFPGKDELIVKGGQIIAYSGNTGGSSGPHLHFEIRDGNQRPMNPMLFGFKLPDAQFPEFAGLYAYPLNDSSHVNQYHQRTKLRLINNGNGHYTTESVEASGEIAFAIDAFDRLDQAANKNGLVCIETKINGQQNFLIDFNKFSFDETKHVNRLIDYEYFRTSKRRLQLLYQKTNNPLSLYKNIVNKGRLTVEPNQNIVYQIIITDFNGNASSITVPINHAPALSVPNTNDSFSEIIISQNQSMTINESNCSIYFPKNCFYDDIPISVEYDNDTLRIIGPEAAAQKSFAITFDTSQYTTQDRKHLLIASVWGKNRKMYPVYTNREGNNLRAYAKVFGNYTLTEDRTPPTIEPENFKSGQWMSKFRYLKLRIADDFSGVSGYRATINGKWILMEYESKTGMLTYDFNDEAIKESEHKLIVVVTDNVGNSATFESVFYRQ